MIYCIFYNGPEAKSETIAFSVCRRNQQQRRARNSKKKREFFINWHCQRFNKLNLFSWFDEFLLFSPASLSLPVRSDFLALTHSFVITSGRASFCLHTLNQSVVAVVIPTFRPSPPITITIGLLIPIVPRKSTVTFCFPLVLSFLRRHEYPESQRILSHRLHIMMKTLHIDGVPSLSLRPSLLLHIYNWSLISKSNMRHCRTLPLFQFSHRCYQQHSSCAGNNLSWYRWHLSMNSLNKRQLNNKNCPRNTRSISFKDSRIFYGEDLSFFAAPFSAIKTTTNSESRWRRPQARSRWTDIQ